MKKKSQIEKLTNRSKEIFRCLVETYLNTGEPVGSRTLAKNLRNNLSSSTIRNIMQDLEESGLLGSIHISSGRIPTHTGLRLFVDGLLEISDMTKETKKELEDLKAMYIHPTKEIIVVKQWMEKRIKQIEEKLDDS